jgi:acetyltransferase-like isoleucine patch superfamily enzyme
MELLKKGIRVLVFRPTVFFKTCRGYLLFARARVLRALGFGQNQQIKLGINVRLQKLSSLSAEKPHAHIVIGNHSIIYENAQIYSYGMGRIQIGERCVIGDVRIYSRSNITIGQRCIFSWNVFMQDFHPHPVNVQERAKQLISITDFFIPRFNGYKPQNQRMVWNFPVDDIQVGDDVWFGANTILLPGSKVGSGSIIAAGAVVTRGEYPANAILAGNPAKVVKIIGQN